MQWVKGSTPDDLSKGEGCKVTDIDNNNYIDYVLGLMPIILGYVDKDINDAIERQMKNGITFSLPTLLEEELADILIENIPCAEMVRFGKNGSDVTAAAIRLSRAYTNRDYSNDGLPWLARLVYRHFIKRPWCS